MTYHFDDRHPPRPDLTTGPVFSIESQCRNKLRYANRAEARVARRQQPWLKLAIYRCAHCGYFHLGKRKPTPPEEGPNATQGS